MGVCPFCFFYMIKFFVFIFTLLLSLSAYASENVAFSPQWLALVHYRPTWFGGYYGSIDSDTFYLADDGRENPQSELTATINLFEMQKDVEKICFFPARYLFLKRNGLVTADFPNCSEYEKLVDDLRPDGVTLLFTDAYMNNPSSLFGHTLIRIDTARKGTQLLAHGLNYGAFTGPNPGPLYALWGLTGGYYGGYTLKPYYDIINTYNNIENRDIWELSLDFTPEEKELFVAHVWELGHTQTRYYFFTQNCSYMLMELLDAVRPDLKLADEFWAQTIPLDTFKAVYRKPNLVKSVNYRPSRQHKLMYQHQQMNEAQEKAFVSAINQQDYSFRGLSEEEKADVSEAVYRYVQYQNVAKELSLEEYRRRSFKLLMARNQIDQKGSFKELKTANSPLEAHESKRIVLGAGVRNGEGFQQVSFRPAYHSLTDNTYGFLRGAEINFLNLTARHYDSSDSYVLHDFDVLGIKSLSPINDMFQPLSYNIQFGINRENNPNSGKDNYVANLVVGAGGAIEPVSQVFVFALLNNYAAYGGALPRNQYVGLGPTVGVYADIGDFRLLAQAEQFFATSDYGKKVKYSLEAAYALSTNVALSFDYNYQQNHGAFDDEEAMLGMRFYF